MADSRALRSATASAGLSFIAPGDPALQPQLRCGGDLGALESSCDTAAPPRPLDGVEPEVPLVTEYLCDGVSHHLDVVAGDDCQFG